MIKKHVHPRWERHLFNILNSEGDINAIIFFQVPINHITGIPARIKSKVNIPVLYYDGDLPTNLPQYSDNNTFRFNQYKGADLAEFDAFLGNSTGAIPMLKELGARNVHAIHYGVDPAFYTPLNVEQKHFDIFYYSHRSRTKEERINYMITQPSETLSDVNFLVGGKGNETVYLGHANTCGILPLSSWRTYCCRSKININITNSIDAQVYATASARPFELASMGCCVVSDSYYGLSEWFEIGSEMFMAQNATEATEIYRMLLASESRRIKTGELARERVLRQHTIHHRAKEFMSVVQALTQ